MKSTKFKEWIRVIKFTLVSISAALVQTLSFALFNDVFKWDYWYSYLFSLLLSVLWNFTINRKVTFKAANNIKTAMLLVLLFYAVFTPVSTILGNWAENKGINEYIVLVITMLSNFILEFLYTRFVVYRHNCDTISKGKKQNKFYGFCKRLVKLFYRKSEVIGIENLPEEPALIIGNHAQLKGPLFSELYFPTSKKIWCIGQMMKMKEVPNYAYQDFWSHKTKLTKWFYKLLSYIIAPIASFIFNNADTIAVYRDSRVISTFKTTARELDSGKNIIIFPEKALEYNEIINDFQDKFVEVAQLYYRRYNKIVSFVPMYNATRLKKVVFGKPIAYNPNIDIKVQSKLICDYLKEEITNLAKELPRHRVIPYSNIKKKNYPYSK